MTCPNCGAPLNDNANFCQTCGFALDSIPRVEPIVVHLQPEEPTVVQPAPPPLQEVVPVVVQPAAASNTPLLVMLGLVLFVAVCALAFFAYVYFNRQNPAIAVNANASNATTVTVKATPKPTEDFGDWLDSVAPETKRLLLLDEQFELAPAERRATAFEIPADVKSARIVGGLKVVRGETVDFYVYPKAAYDEQYPPATLPPIHYEATRNKKINVRLPAGEYVLVFETTPAAAKGVIVASNIVLVFD